MILNLKPKTSTVDGQIDGFSLYISRLFLCRSILYVHLNWNRRIREIVLGLNNQNEKKKIEQKQKSIDFVKCNRRSSVCNSGPYAELYNLNVKCIFWMIIQDREIIWDLAAFLVWISSLTNFYFLNHISLFYFSWFSLFWPNVF